MNQTASNVFNQCKPAHYVLGSFVPASLISITRCRKNLAETPLLQLLTSDTLPSDPVVWQDPAALHLLAFHRIIQAAMGYFRGI